MIFSVSFVVINMNILESEVVLFFKGNKCDNLTYKLNIINDREGLFSFAEEKYKVKSGFGMDTTFSPIRHDKKVRSMQNDFEIDPSASR